MLTYRVYYSSLDDAEVADMLNEEVEDGDEDNLRKQHMYVYYIISLLGQYPVDTIFWLNCKYNFCYRLNLQRDDEAEIEAIKAGVMGGFKRRVGNYDDESEAALAAAARRAAARMRRSTWMVHFSHYHTVFYLGLASCAYDSFYGTFL